jgi:hypothetical protein
MTTRGLPHVYDDGGRKAAGFKGRAGDCFCRSVAIAAQMPYAEAYALINAFSARERKSARRSRRSSARDGVHRATARRVMAHLGFTWVPCMTVGAGCKVHVREGELPSTGRLILSLSKHFTAVVDGIVHDTYDPSREGTRCVYGYWSAPAPDDGAPGAQILLRLRG